MQNRLIPRLREPITARLQRQARLQFAARSQQRDGCERLVGAVTLEEVASDARSLISRTVCCRWRVRMPFVKSKYNLGTQERPRRNEGNEERQSNQDEISLRALRCFVV